jgi:sensory rhodopsin
VLWAIAAMLADADRRLVAFAAAVPFVQVAAFWVAPVYGGAVALASLAVVVGSHLVLAVVFARSVWAATSGLSEHRRLLHWKARNLLLFLIGMFIVFSFLSVAQAFSDFGTVVLNQYVSLLIRVGFAAFLFANVDALGGTTAGRATYPPDRAATGDD